MVDKAKDTCKVPHTDGMILYLMIINNFCKYIKLKHLLILQISDLQVFRLFPPACMQEGKLIYPTTDWSRTAHNKIFIESSIRPDRL